MSGLRDSGEEIPGEDRSEIEPELQALLKPLTESHDADDSSDQLEESVLKKQKRMARLIIVLALIIIVMLAVVLYLLFRGTAKPAQPGPDIITTGQPGSSPLPTDTPSPINTPSQTDAITGDPTPTSPAATTTEPQQQITSIVITYAGQEVHDFTEPIGMVIRLGVRIEPSGTKLSEPVVWQSSNTDVFTVEPENPEGTSAKVTIIGASAERYAVLTASIGGVSAKCDVRHPNAPPPGVVTTDSPNGTASITSLVITYAGQQVVDITESVGMQIPLRVRIEPAGITLGEPIIWHSSNTGVFEVKPDNPEGTSATITIIGTAQEKRAILTVSIGKVSAGCNIRVR